MKRILITGFSGFVARHFLEFLVNNAIDAEILGIDLFEPVYDIREYEKRANLKISFCVINMLDSILLFETIASFKPDYILHLASFSSVAYSWEHPEDSFLNNTNIFLNLIRAVRDSQCECRVLSVGSSEQYGNVDTIAIPISEDMPLKPLSPYAVARTSQEMLSLMYARSYEIDIVVTRSFNHIGKWQNRKFVIPGIIDKIKNAESLDGISRTIFMGDISIVRDFVAVEDVVKAYWMLLNNAESGEIYNICSGVGTSIEEMINLIADIMNVKINIQRDCGLYRPADNKIIVGSHDKITRKIGWMPEISIEESLRRMIYENS